MMKYKRLIGLISFLLILGGCSGSKTKDIDKKISKKDPQSLEVSEEIEESVCELMPDLSSEENIREYLKGEWFLDMEYVSDVTCNMNIDDDLNLSLLFYNNYTYESKGEYKGKIKFDRIYSEQGEAPDLISIELIDTDYPGGDFFFLHRTIFDEKRIMSLFSAGNGNCIFDMLADVDNFEYGPNEVVFEKATGEISQLKPNKDDEFYAVFWGKEESGKLWLDDVKWTPSGEDDFEAMYPGEMTNYENDVPESILYSIVAEEVREILGDDLFPGQVYFVETNGQGNVTSFISAEHKRYLEHPYDEEDYGFESFQNTDIGESKTVKSYKASNLIKESGPFTIKVIGSEVLDLYLFDEFKEDFDNKDKLTIITIALEIEHNVIGINGIYPELGVVVLNTTEEAEVYSMLSDHVGGMFTDISGTRGNLTFILNSEAKDIKAIRYIINGAEDEDYNIIGEDIEFKIQF